MPETLNRFGDELGETKEQTNRFGDIIPKDPFGRPIIHVDRPSTGQLLVEDYVRPTLQGLGSAGGAFLGTSTGPVGAVAGGTLGFGISSEIADLLETWMGYKKPLPIFLDMQEAGERLIEGATYEMGGAALGPAVKVAGKGIAHVAKRPVIGAPLRAIGKAGKGIKEFATSIIPASEKGVEKIAGQELMAMTDYGPMIVKDIQKAKALEELIPGLEFDLGQLTGDIGVIAYRPTTSMHPGDLAARQTQRIAKNTKAINDFIEKTKGSGTAEDFIESLSKKKTSLSEAEQLAKFNLEQEAFSRKGLQDPMETGRTIREELEAAEKAAREKAGELFAAVPKQNLVVDDLYDEFLKILKPLHKTEGPKKFPGVLKRAIEVMEPPKRIVPSDVEAKALADIAKVKGITPKKGKLPIKDIKGEGKWTFQYALEDEPGFRGTQITLTETGKNWAEAATKAKKRILDKGHKFKESNLIRLSKFKPKVEPTESTMSLKDIQGLRSEILEDLRTARDKGLPKSYRARLAQALEAIDQKLGMGGKGVPELQKAQKFFREEVIEKYHKGSSKAILRGEESVQDAMVAGKYFKPGAKGEQAASEFMSAMGDNETARVALKEYIDQNMLDAVTNNKTKEITEAALNRWLKSHRLALKKLGLEDEYISAVKSRQSLNEIIAKSKDFEESVATRVLKVDVNEAIKKAFSRGSKKKAAEDLMKQITWVEDLHKTEPAAIKTPDGKIHTGINHPLIASDLSETKAYNKLFDQYYDRFSSEKINIQEGFVTKTGKFITRKQAKIRYGFDHTWGKSLPVTKNAKKAIAGLQNAMVDEILTQFPLDKSAGELLTSKQMTSQLAKYDPALKVVFNNAPEKYNAMFDVRNAIRILEGKTTTVPKGGLQRAQDIIINRAHWYGFSKSRAAAIARGATKPLREYRSNEINELINRAIFDPELAYGLIYAAKTGKTSEAKKFLIMSLTRMGLIKQTREREKSKEKD